MNMPMPNPPSCVCGGTPSLRDTTTQEAFIAVCDTCHQFGEPSLREEGAWASWRNITSVEVVCLGCGGRPRMEYSKANNTWRMGCINRSCRYLAGAAFTIEGAIASWRRQNKPRCPHTLEQWKKIYRYQQEPVHAG